MLKKIGNMEGERFRTMIDNVPLGAHLYELMPDNRLIFIGANRLADIILAAKNDKFIGKTIEEAFPNLTTTDIPDAYRDVARNGIPFNMEQILYSDNQGISGAFEISAFQTETNKMAVLFRDITEKKKAEEALQASERRFKELIKNSTDSITILDKNGLQIYVSDVVEKMLGYKKNELLNIPVVEQMVHLEDQAHVQEAFSKIIREGQGGAQYRHRHKNGTWVHLEAWGTNQLENPDIRGVVVNVRDITDRKRMEAQLAESEARFKALHNASFGGIAIHDKGVILDCNKGMSELTGYSFEELTEMDGLLLIAPQSRNDVMANIVAGYEKPYEAIGIKKNGEEYSLRLEARNIPYKGKMVRVVEFRDITERVRAEEEKRKALEFAAEQSKLSLIGQVAGKMAHDFNNILMGIMGNAQLAVMECYDQQIKEKLERIVAYSERGRDITNNLISYSKDQEPKQTYFKIEDKIDLILKMYEKELKDIEVSRNYMQGIPTLLADPGMIQDVLANLLQNSIHAMSMVETPRLKLKTYSQDDKVYFEIEDNGCGIPKEHQDSIFTPSFTLKGSHDKTGSYKLGIKGTGYGMSNVKKYIVEKHKGNISLESELGKGTKITIALKIIKNRLSPDEKKEVVKSQIYDKRRILLVEDEAAIADVQYQILTKEPFNHVVSAAVNGQMAIDVFDRNKFDVVSLDYMLPGNINGLDVYNHIRKNDGDIPVMFISGNIEFLESIKKLKEKDPNLEHLSKPVSNLEYVNKINELIGRTSKIKI